MTKTTISARADKTIEAVGFGVKDRFGREIGADVITEMVTFVPVAEAGYGGFWFSREPGTFYTWAAQATRGGNTYGASFPTTHYHRTEAERTAAIAKYLDGARKRAAKREGK